MNINLCDEIVIKFLIDNPENIFNRIVKSITFENKNERQTRSSINNCYSCKYTQFILVSLCLVNSDDLIYLIKNYDYMMCQKNKIKFNIILSSIGSQFNNIYSQISNNSSIKNSYAINNEILHFSDVMLKKSISLLVTLSNLKYMIIPVCLYYNQLKTERVIIIHYFTIIIEKKNKIFYINSSYGSDNFYVCNKTIPINNYNLFKIIKIFNNLKKNSKNIKIIKQFVKKYFLCDVINFYNIDEEINTIINCNIGYIKEYAKIFAF